ncbi:hypothetical protein E2320_013690 [Naja naja]|nr:hypothetical protein E2320_013690 [Naja naja]
MGLASWLTGALGHQQEPGGGAVRPKKGLKKFLPGPAAGLVAEDIQRSPELFLRFCPSEVPLSFLSLGGGVATKHKIARFKMTLVENAAVFRDVGKMELIYSQRLQKVYNA